MPISHRLKCILVMTDKREIGTFTTEITEKQIDNLCLNTEGNANIPRLRTSYTLFSALTPTVFGVEGRNLFPLHITRVDLITRCRWMIHEPQTFFLVKAMSQQKIEGKFRSTDMAMKEGEAHLEIGYHRIGWTDTPLREADANWLGAEEPLKRTLGN